MLAIDLYICMFFLQEILVFLQVLEKNINFYDPGRFEQISHTNQSQHCLSERQDCKGYVFYLNRVKEFFFVQFASARLHLLNWACYCFAILKLNKLHGQMEFYLVATLPRLRSCKHFHMHQVNLPISSMKQLVIQYHYTLMVFLSFIM